MLEDIDRAQTEKDIDRLMTDKEKLYRYENMPMYMKTLPQIGSFGTYQGNMPDSLSIAPPKQIVEEETPLPNKIFINDSDYFQSQPVDSGVAALAAAMEEGYPTEGFVDTRPDGPDTVLKKKPQPKKVDEKSETKEEEEDIRPKGLKDYLKDIMSDGDALIALGGAIARGEGLVGGLEDFSEARKATKALQREIATQQFERDRQTKLDEYTIATAQMDIAYKQSQLTTDEVKNAQSAAEFEALSEGIDPKSPDLTTAQIERYYQILNKKMDMIINKEKPLTTGALGEQIAMNAILGNEDATVTTGGNTYKIVDGQFTKVE